MANKLIICCSSQIMVVERNELTKKILTHTILKQLNKKTMTSLTNKPYNTSKNLDKLVLIMTNWPNDSMITITILKSNLKSYQPLWYILT